MRQNRNWIELLEPVLNFVSFSELRHNLYLYTTHVTPFLLFGPSLFDDTADKFTEK